MRIAVDCPIHHRSGSPTYMVAMEIDFAMANRKIDFEIAYKARQLPYSDCGVGGQSSYDRGKRSWRNLYFLCFRAWLHAEVPHIDCSICGKTIQVKVLWTRPSSGLPLLFKSFSLLSYQKTSVAYSTAQLRVVSKRLRQKVHPYVTSASERRRAAGRGADDVEHACLAATLKEGLP